MFTEETKLIRLCDPYCTCLGYLPTAGISLAVVCQIFRQETVIELLPFYCNPFLLLTITLTIHSVCSSSRVYIFEV